MSDPVKMSLGAPFSVFPARIECRTSICSTTWASPIVAAIAPPPMFGLPLKIAGNPVTAFSTIVELVRASEPLDM